MTKHDRPSTDLVDCSFTHAAHLTHSHTHQCVTVGELNRNRTVVVGQAVTRSAWANTIPTCARHPITINGKTQDWVSKSLCGPTVKHPVWLVLLWCEREAEISNGVLGADRTFWKLTRILTAYRYGWTGPEPVYRGGKPQRGIGDGQLRNGKGQTPSMHLVFLA